MTTKRKKSSANTMEYSISPYKYKIGDNVSYSERVYNDCPHCGHEKGEDIECVSKIIKLEHNPPAYTNPLTFIDDVTIDEEGTKIITPRIAHVEQSTVMTNMYILDSGETVTEGEILDLIL